MIFFTYNVYIKNIIGFGGLLIKHFFGLDNTFHLLLCELCFELEELAGSVESDSLPVNQILLNMLILIYPIY